MQKQTFQILIGNRVKQLRKEKHLTQTDLAHLCGKDCQSLERVENGKTNPTAFYLLEVCKALDVSLNEFFDFKIEPPKKR